MTWKLQWKYKSSQEASFWWVKGFKWLLRTKGIESRMKRWEDACSSSPTSSSGRVNERRAIMDQRLLGMRFAQRLMKWHCLCNQSVSLSLDLNLRHLNCSTTTEELIERIQSTLLRSLPREYEIDEVHLCTLPNILAFDGNKVKRTN